MKATRIVVVLGILGLFAAALVFERDPQPATVPLTVDLDRMVPTVPGAEALATTWYCAAGSASGEGPAEQTLIIANDGETAVEASLTVHTETGEQVREQVELDARSRTQVRVSEIVTSEWASVVVESPGGGVGVDHVVSGPTGRAVGPCASSVAPTWYVPLGSSSLGVANRLAIFNPFAADAVVDIAFETETDRRTPPEYDGLVIPAGHVRVLPIDEVVTVREQISTQVVARTGLVVVEQIELVGEESEQPTSTTLMLGSPGTAETWHMPAGRPLGGDVTSRVVVFNPGEEDAEVDVQVMLEDPQSHTPVEPFELTVFAGQFAEVDLLGSGRVPEGVEWSAFAASRNGVPVVAAVATAAGGGSDPRGQSRTLGTPVTATEWRIPYGGAGGGEMATIDVVNPTSEPRHVRLEAVGGGEVTVSGADPVVVPPGERARLTLDPAGASGPGEGEEPGDEDAGTGGSLDAGATSWRVVADGGVVVARTSTFVDGAGFDSAPASAVSGSLALAPAPDVDLTVDPSIALEGIVPDDATDEDTDPNGSTDDSGSEGSSDDGSTTEGTDGSESDGADTDVDGPTSDATEPESESSGSDEDGTQSGADEGATGPNGDDPT